MRNHMSTQHDQHGLEIANFHLPWTKAAPLGEDVNWAKQDSPINPHSAIHNHFSINNPPNEAHIFMYRVKNGHCPLTHSKFLKTLEKATKSTGISPLKGHAICYMRHTNRDIEVKGYLEEELTESHNISRQQFMVTEILEGVLERDSEESWTQRREHTKSTLDCIEPV